MKNTDSITNLLKQHKVDISAVKANKILVDLGLLLEKERPSSKYAGKMKNQLKKAGGVPLIWDSVVTSVDLEAGRLQVGGYATWPLTPDSFFDAVAVMA